MRVARFAIEGGGFDRIGVVAEADAGYRVHGDDIGRFIPYDEAAARRMVGGIEGGEESRGDRIGYDHKGKENEERKKKCGRVFLDNRREEEGERNDERDGESEITAARKGEDVGDENEDGRGEKKQFRATRQADGEHEREGKSHPPEKRGDMRIGKKAARTKNVSSADTRDHTRKFRDDAGEGNAGKNWKNILLPEEHRRIESDCEGKEKLKYADYCRECGTDDEPSRKSLSRMFFLKDGKRDEEEWNEGEEENELSNSPRNILREEE